jgi:predicted RNA-binding protein YlqC (UPF0109 family)
MQCRNQSAPFCMEAVAGIQDFVSYVVTGLTGRPEKANVSCRQEGSRHVFDVRVDEGDIGRVLGHSGNTVMAVRNLAAAAAAHQGLEVGVEILE